MFYLKLNLTGVLQYYSSNDSTALRTTYLSSLVPTKKAIIGLIGCALGINRDDPYLIELYAQLDVKYSINKNPSILEDFQTIKPLKSQKLYMNKYYTRNKFTTVGGGQRDGALIKNIQYLQDASYDIFIGADSSLLQTIYNAIQNPVYALYFGKRSCVPNQPIVTEFKLFSMEDLENVYDCA